MFDRMIKRRELMRLGAATIAGGVALEASGCATLMNLFEKYLPKLHVKSMNITGMTLSTISTKFICELSNPNPIGFRLDGLDYLLRVAGNELAKGRAPRGVTLKPRQAAQTDLDIDFNLGKTAEAILDLIGKKVVPFELQATGKFFAAQSGGIDVPVGFKGSMPMPKEPGFGVKGFAPTNISASAVSFRADTTLHNNNDFEIPIDGFNFDVKLDGKKVIENKAVSGLRVSPGKTANVPLDFRVGLVELGVSLAEIAAGKRMSYELATDVRSGKLTMPFKNTGSFRFS
jgi:LEA14-like dessication related protein